VVTVGLLVRLVAKPGKEVEVTASLREGCRWWNRNGNDGVVRNPPWTPW
jgi:hypothetical protein